VFPQIKVTEFKNSPIILPEEKTQNKIKELVEKISEIKQQNNETDTTELENQINEIFYKLYSLTKDEIKMIEKG
jgi:adenine-specific DNA-methyltransferase